MEWQPADIVAFKTPGFTSAVIRAVTFGSVSHVGIVSKLDDRLVLVESTTLAAGGAPCLVQGKRVKGVKVHPLSEALTRPGKIWRYPVSQRLTPKEERRLKIFLLGMVGRNYDYVGALASGPRLLRWASWLFKEESLNSLFCSELCMSAYCRLLRMSTRSASIFNPNSMLRRMRRRGAVLEPARLK